MAVKNDKVAQKLAKLANKALNKEILASTFVEVPHTRPWVNKLKNTFKYLKNNPTTAKALAVIGFAGIIVATMIAIDCLHKNGKIEGKYQQIADSKSKN